MEQDGMSYSVVTPWGRLVVSIGEGRLRGVAFDGAEAPPLEGPWGEAFAGYLAGRAFPSDLAIELAGVPTFTRRVLEACREIPFGETRSYRELAAAIGAPGAARAVGQALARNPAPVVIPCHRVLGAGGQLTGFLGGLAWKKALLAHEGVKMDGWKNGRLEEWKSRGIC